MDGSTAPPLSEFDDFVRARSAALTASAFLLTGDRGLAEDLVQDALARTWRAWKRLHRSQNAEAYTRRTMYHLHVSRWRRRRVAETATETPPEPGGADPDVALRLAVHAALLSLPAKQRAAVVLRYFEDMTESDAAATLGCPVSTLRTRTQRALRGLRRGFPELRFPEAEPPRSGAGAMTARGESHV
ncbi:SigE family RNA polymerase sigma factor [Glycomyces arizonensis]|uniref:SigE family RNA polymerase sigma factor n=1 Tax=Glycomyces arizonensis TaxID=256035 RepID=UPI000410C172|nr:SigE family RNA polymerase sigma factor [Glycomyces arizonensis]